MKMTNEELQIAIDKAVEHYIRLRGNANSQDHGTRDEAHCHLVRLMEQQAQRATKDVSK